MVNWPVTSNRLVAFLDIMGFQDLVFRTDHHQILKLMQDLQQTLKVLDSLEPENEQKWLVKSVLFSDSILLISADDSVDSLRQIVFGCEYLIGTSLREGVPIKGAIALGEQTTDFEKSIHFGKPLIDAYKLQQELLFYGVVVHNSVEQVFKKEQLDSELLRKCKLPLRAGKVSHYAVDWRYLNNSKVEDCDVRSLEIVESLYKTVSGTARLYVDNTLDYIRWLNDTYKN